VAHRGDPPPERQLQEQADSLTRVSTQLAPRNGTVPLAAHREDDAAVLEVTDTGLGIPRVEQSDLFNR
jgi:signal transduction histidine kinase